MIIGILGESGVGKDTAGLVLAKALGGTCISFAAPMKEWCNQVLQLPQVWGGVKVKDAPLSKAARARAERSFGAWADTGGVIMVGGRSAVLTPMMDELDVACGRDRPYPTVGAGFEYNSTRAVCERAIYSWWARLRGERSLTTRLILQTFGTEFGRQYLGDGFWGEAGLERATRVLKAPHARAIDLPNEAPAGVTVGVNAAIITDVRFRNECVLLKQAGARILRIVRPGLKKGKKASHVSESEQSTIPDWWCNHVCVNDGSLEAFKGHIQVWAKSVCMWTSLGRGSHCSRTHYSRFS